MGSDIIKEHPAVLANGTPLRMIENTKNQPAAMELGMRTHTYIGHLNSTEHAVNMAITPMHKLAIFHYVTRSLSDYSQHKTQRPSGIYAWRYRQRARKTRSALADKDMFAKFEVENGFHGTAPICSSVAQLYPKRCCTPLLRENVGFVPELTSSHLDTQHLRADSIRQSQLGSA